MYTYFAFCHLLSGEQELRKRRHSLRLSRVTEVYSLVRADDHYRKDSSDRQSPGRWSVERNFSRWRVDQAGQPDPRAWSYSGEACTLGVHGVQANKYVGGLKILCPSCYTVAPSEPPAASSFQEVPCTISLAS